MVTAASISQRALSDVAERQMRSWALGLQAQEQSRRLQAERPAPCLFNPFIAISREAGTGAGELARSVAAKCGLTICDRELIDLLAERDHLSRLALEFVDERTSSWFHEMFGRWLEKELISQAEYVIRLRQIVQLAAQHESTVYVGRGVQFMLPRDRCLAVRLVAGKLLRVKRTAERYHCSDAQAAKLMDETDDARAEFVKRYFHQDVADPHIYDLVVNLDYVGREAAVDIVVGEFRRRF
jgi:cytidylate kinase